MPLQDFVNKEGYIATVAGLSATLAGQATDPSTERELPWLTQTQIALEVTVAFNALADGGLRVRILEYMTSGSAATEATPGQEGTIPLTAGSTIRQTFNFTVRSRYYIVELFNLDSAAGRDATSIAVQVIETPESEESQDGQVNTHTQYWDEDAWQPQLIMAWETGGNLDQITAAVEIMDDWDETNRAAVNLIAGQVGVQGAEGIINALTQRVTLATDDDAVTSLGIMDDWDETDRAAVNLIAGQVGVQGGAGAVSALTQRVILATNDPAVTALAKQGRTITVTNATWTGDSSTTTSLSANFRLCHITIHYDAGIAEDCTVSLDANDGVNYDTVLRIADNSAGGVTDNVFEFDDGHIFENGDEIKVAVNVGANNAYVRIVTEAI